MPEKQNSNQENEHPNQRLPSIATTIQNPTNEHYDRTEPRQQCIREWARLFVEFAALCGLIYYANSASIQARANVNAAKAAKQAADTATLQEKAWEVSQRPWIEVDHPSIRQTGQAIPPVVALSPVQPLLQNIPYSPTVTLKALGGTPALHAYTEMVAGFVKLPNQRSPFLQNVEAPKLDLCAPTASWMKSDWTGFPTGTYPIVANLMFPATVNQIQDLLKGRSAIYLYGCVRYKDAFCRKYQTNFCFNWSTVDSPPEWHRCIDGNDLITYPPEDRTKDCR